MKETVQQIPPHIREACGVLDAGGIVAVFAGVIIGGLVFWGTKNVPLALAVYFGYIYLCSSITVVGKIVLEALGKTKD